MNILQKFRTNPKTVAGSWRELEKWVLPSSDAEKRVLEAELDNIKYESGKHPKIFFAKVNSISNKLELVGVQED